MVRRTVAVVGGGCAGVLAIREILNGSADDVVLIEPDQPGGGLAYGSARPWHLLNSRAGAMSADPGDPGHFARWAGCSPDEFRPRQEYGRYLRTVFAEVATEHGDRLTVRPERATGLTAAGVTLAGGDLVRAGDVVVATGNPAAAQPAARPGHPDYLADPWLPCPLDAIPTHVPVLLIGAGLTAIDVALTLTADGRRDSPITMVSRRGQLPLTHTATAAPAAPPILDGCRTLRDVVRAVRSEAGRATTGVRWWTGCGRTWTSSGPLSPRPSRTRSCGTWPGRGSVTGTGWRPRSAPGSRSCGPRAASRCARAASDR